VRYTVGWVQLAEDKLANLWMGSRRANQITKATDWFDANLAVRPNDIGESRPGDFRIAFEGPIGILFFVDEADKKVFVVDVWTI
jgi:hypothetical protein